MFKNILKKLVGLDTRQDQNSGEAFIYIKLNDRVMPIDRGYLYEDPLDEFLQAHQYGTVTGGGTMQGQSGEILYGDIELMIYEGKDAIKIMDEVISKLEELGAPKGSSITIAGMNEAIAFGRAEGMAIYLDGVNLPEEVYKACDSNYVLSELSKLLGYRGQAQRYWQGDTETAFYFYGESFSEMQRAVSGFMDTYPLCKGARIIQIN